MRMSSYIGWPSSSSTLKKHQQPSLLVPVLSCLQASHRLDDQALFSSRLSQWLGCLKPRLVRASGGCHVPTYTEEWLHCCS